MPLSPSWTTEREIDFLKKLGSHQPDRVRAKSERPTRRMLLERYLKSMPLRKDWDACDPLMAEMFVRRELSKWEK